MPSDSGVVLVGVSTIHQTVFCSFIVGVSLALPLKKSFNLVDKKTN